MIASPFSRRALAASSLAALLLAALIGPASAQSLVIEDVEVTAGVPNIHCLLVVDVSFTGGKGKSVTLGYRLWRDGVLFGTFDSKVSRGPGQASGTFILPRRETPHAWQVQVAAVKAKGSKITAIGGWIDPTPEPAYLCPAFPD